MTSPGDCRRTGSKAGRLLRLLRSGTHEGLHAELREISAMGLRAGSSTLEAERLELLQAVAGRLDAIPPGGRQGGHETCLRLLGHLARPGARHAGAGPA